MALLDGARGGVVDDGVAEHIVERVGALHVLAVAPDDDAELTFVIGRMARVGRGRQALPRIGERAHRLGEDDRKLRDLHLVAGLVDAAAGEFLGVIVIVLADRHDVLGQRADRGGELDLVERLRRTVFRRGRALAHQLDDVAQIAHRSAADQKRAEAVVLDGSENLGVLVVDCRDTHDVENASSAGPAAAGRFGRGFNA